MKSAKQIADSCNLDRQIIHRIIQKEEMIPVKQIGRRNFYDKWQEEHIHTVLYFSGLLEEITIESKINNEPEETFAEFKARTYGRRH